LMLSICRRMSESLRNSFSSSDLSPILRLGFVD
jgi:hypothetical protein